MVGVGEGVSVAEGAGVAEAAPTNDEGAEGIGIAQARVTPSGIKRMRPVKISFLRFVIITFALRRSFERVRRFFKQALNLT